jgi:hypothetical protein
MEREKTFTAFAEGHIVASGPLSAVLPAVKRRAARNGPMVLVFEDETGRQVDFDLRGTLEEVIARAAPPAPPQGRGRPKLGVASREVSLLPRHWEWLDDQSTGVSATLRRLVEEARKRDPAVHQQKRAMEAASRVMTAIAGNRPHFEEASRALFARDEAAFALHTRRWPADVRTHLGRMLEGAWAAPTAPAAPG